MKKKLLNAIKNSIKRQYPNYTEEKIDEIMYGIEGIYLTITKTIVIFLIAFILGIYKNLFFLLLSFNFIRLFAFGMHANNSFMCLLLSSIIFLGFAFASKYVALNINLVAILYLLIILIMILYAPADTVKRPLIKRKKRIKFKFLSVLVTIIYFILTIFLNNNTISNYLLFGLIIECILILPITYKLFGMPYNNYKTYGLSTKN